MDALGRRCLKCQPSSRTGENPPYGMIGGTVETSASFEARYAPLSYPTAGGDQRWSSLPRQLSADMFSMGGRETSYPLVDRIESCSSLSQDHGVLLTPRCRNDLIKTGGGSTTHNGKNATETVPFPLTWDTVLLLQFFQPLRLVYL